MRTYNSLKPTSKKCIHKISIGKHCLDCLDYEIRNHETSIRLLKRTRRFLIKEGLVTKGAN